jgi:hypothetical protein
MHSYDNGTALNAKRDNWNQLQKFFRRTGIADVVTEEEIGRMIRCEDGVSVIVMTRIYETLTQRRITQTTKKPTIGKPAGYARDTGAWKVRETLRKGGFGDDSDLNTVSKVSRDASDEHEKSIHEGRSIDPEKFATVSIAPSVTQMAPRAHDSSADQTLQVRVKEIQVKQLDRNVTHLRASKQMNGGGPSGNIPGAGSPTSRHARAITPAGAGGLLDDASQVSEKSNGSLGGGIAVVGPGMMLPENAVSLLNSCISRIMGTHNISTWNNAIDPLQNMMTLLEMMKGRSSNSGDAVEGLVNAALSEIRMSTQQLAEACVVTPKQFWKVSDLLTAAISSCLYQSQSFATAVESFESLGRWIFQRDPRSSLSLFCDFALFKLARTLNEHPYKRLGILRVLYSFSPHDTLSHVQCIKRLQAIVPDLRVFICCLTILATLETELDVSLLDLYQYYATIGLGMPSPRLRAGAAAVMSSLYPLAGGMISPMLPQLKSIASTETWWEMHAHLLTLCAAILDPRIPFNRYEMDPATDEGAGVRVRSEDEECALEMIDIIFTPSSSKTVQQWGLVTLARVTAYGDEVSMKFLDVIQAVDDDSRRFLLDLGEQKSDVRKIMLPSSTGVDFVLEPIVSRINPLVIARAIESKIISDRLERLDPGLVQTLLAVVKASAQRGSVQSVVRRGNSSADNDESEITLDGPWLDIYHSLKDFILVALCDARCAEDAAGILIEYILRSPTQDGIIADNKFLNTLRLVYPVDGKGDITCQSSLEAFFEHVYYLGDYYAAAVVNTIELFAKNYTGNYEVSNLQKLLKDFISSRK